MKRKTIINTVVTSAAASFLVVAGLAAIKNMNKDVDKAIYKNSHRCYRSGKRYLFCAVNYLKNKTNRTIFFMTMFFVPRVNNFKKDCWKKGNNQKKCCYTKRANGFWGKFFCMCTKIRSHNIQLFMTFLNLRMIIKLYKLQ